MREVDYTRSDPWVRSATCTNCNHVAFAWCASGMSGVAPHFYCDVCSNAIHRASDTERLAACPPSLELLAEITETLPGCPCGGRFRAETNPKCPRCLVEFKHRLDAVARLSDRQVILLDGACLYGDPDDTSRPYRVRITE